MYSFGIIMWQVLTRKEPYADRNFMGVSLDVLEGKRPQLPTDCDKSFKKMMKRYHPNLPLDGDDAELIPLSLSFLLTDAGTTIRAKDPTWRRWWPTSTPCWVTTPTTMAVSVCDS